MAKEIFPDPDAKPRQLEIDNTPIYATGFVTDSAYQMWIDWQKAQDKHQKENSAAQVNSEIKGSNPESVQAPKPAVLVMKTDDWQPNPDMKAPYEY